MRAIHVPIIALIVLIFVLEPCVANNIFANDFKVNTYQVTTMLSDDTNPSLIKVDDKYVLAFCSNRSGNQDIWIMTSQDGNEWLISSQVTTNNSNDYEPAISKGIEKNYTIVFLSNRDYSINIWMSCSDDLHNWSTPIQITDLCNNLPPGPIDGWNSWAKSPSLIYVPRYNILSYIEENHGFIANYTLIKLLQISDWKNLSVCEYVVYLDNNSCPEKYLSSSIAHFNNTYYLIYNKYQNGFIIFSNDLSIWSPPIQYGYGSHPSMLKLSTNTFCIVNTAGIWLSDDLVNWTHVLNKSYEQPSAVQMDDGRIMVAYVKDGDIWVDIVDLGLGEDDNCDDCVFRVIGNFFVENALVAIPAVVVTVGVSVSVGYLLKRRRAN